MHARAFVNQDGGGFRRLLYFLQKANSSCQTDHRPWCLFTVIAANNHDVHLFLTLMGPISSQFIPWVIVAFCSLFFIFFYFRSRHSLKDDDILITFSPRQLEQTKINRLNVVITVFPQQLARGSHCSLPLWINSDFFTFIFFFSSL